MPVYVYRCGDCKGEFEKKHSMFADWEKCDICGSVNSVFKIPCLSEPIKLNSKTKKTGDVVKQFIKDTAKELKKEKKDLRSKEI